MSGDDPHPPLPPHLQLEITSACNLRCVMCLVRYRPPVNKLAGAMPPELFRQIIDEVPTLNRLTLQGLGEPLLSPYLMEMIAAAVARRITVGFNTNATLLNRRRAEELVRSRVDWLHVSLDGASAAGYTAVREGADFEAVVSNLAELVQVKRAAGSATPWIRVVFVAMRDNVAELPELVRLLARLGVDELHVQNLSHSFSDTDPAGRYDDIRRFTSAQALWAGEDAAWAAAVFDDARRVAREHGVRLRLPYPGVPPQTGRRDGPGCSWPWEAAYITSTGVVQPCCMVMGDDRVSLGRLGEQSFPQIWYGEPYRQFRRRLSGDEPPDVCRGCSLYRHAF
ncbi:MULTISPECIES: radical SAM protein [unclassified Plantactinospora]|uniref:radical SAM protein n=1 Tax=unclassified Plantactinospora TaxID=2631981 RepID=UPI000D154041|nr:MULTISPECIES: radical SAM protein [unclassified Plantactinospora]AVT28213.1 pyrroloquinoline quinone biosynthesis protein PqqE [Plantactinospora sp. BC1]AVT38551.1 pyrroloquinoline quinone biosynthesis protein PqqE [Plantactinospora sp. BB1]